MAAGASGEERANRMWMRASELEAAAAEMTAEAARLRDMEERISRGNVGEQVVGGLLDQLPPDRWRVLHDRRKSRQSPANLDHLVIGPPGVLVIDAKNWSGGRLRIDERGMVVGGWRKDNELHSAKVDADVVRDVVAAWTGASPPVIGVLAFVQDMALAEPVTHCSVVLVQRDQLLPWLASLPPTLAPSEVHALTGYLSGAFPPRSRALSRPVTSSPSTPKAPAGAPTDWAPAGTAVQQAAERDRRTQRQLAKRSKRRAKANAELRSGLVRLGLLTVVAVSSPATVPWFADHVLQPLSAHLAKAVTASVPTPQPSPTAR